MFLPSGIPAVIESVPNYGIPVVLGYGQGTPAIMPWQATRFFYSSSFDNTSGNTFYVTGSITPFHPKSGSWGGGFNAASADISCSSSGSLATVNLAFNTMSMRLSNFTTFSAIVSVQGLLVNPFNIGLLQFPTSADYVGFQFDVFTGKWEYTVSNRNQQTVRTTSLFISNSISDYSEFTVFKTDTNTFDFYINRRYLGTINNYLFDVGCTSIMTPYVGPITASIKSVMIEGEVYQ